MAAKLVRVTDPDAHPMHLSCGHTTQGNGAPQLPRGRHARVDDPWYCELCDLDVTIAQLDQELAAADQAAGG